MPDLASHPVTLLAAFAVSVFNPVYGLALVAALSPFGVPVALPFLAGGLMRGLPDTPGPTGTAPAIGCLLAAALVVQAGVAAAVPALTGLGLVVATTVLFRRAPALALMLPRLLAAATAVAAIAGVLRLTDTVSDAGLCAMVGCLALGMSARDRGYRRAGWLAAAGGCAIGVWSAAWDTVAMTLSPRPIDRVVLGLFALWIGAALARTARALARDPHDARLAGAALGVLAFLAINSGGRLVPAGASAPAFWIQLALTSALAGSTLLNQPLSPASPATSSSRARSTRTTPNR